MGAEALKKESTFQRSGTPVKILQPTSSVAPKLPSRRSSLKDPIESPHFCTPDRIRVPERHKKVLFLPDAPSKVTKIDVRSASVIPHRRLVESRSLSQSLSTSPILPGPFTHHSHSFSVQSVDVKPRRPVRTKFKLKLPRKPAVLHEEPSVENQPTYYAPMEEEPVQLRASRSVKTMVTLHNSFNLSDTASRFSALAGLPLLSIEKPMKMAVYKPRTPPKNALSQSVQEEASKSKTRAEYSWKWKGEHGSLA